MKRVIAIFFMMFASAAFSDEAVRPSRVVAASASSPAPEKSDRDAPSGPSARTAVERQKVVRDDIARPTRITASPAPESRTRDGGPSGSASSPAPAAISRSAVEPVQNGSADPAPSAARASRISAAPSSSAPVSERRAASQPSAGSARSATTRVAAGALRPSVAEVGGRAVIGRTQTMTGSNLDEEINKKLTRRARAAENPFAGEVVQPEAPSASTELAECGAQYFDCLNQFCDVLDVNQKQCSCSSRLAQYKKTEDSLNHANEELNNVAQQIRYVGLTADEVRSILKETEAEAVLSSTDDRTQSRRMLEEIEKIIKNPDAASSYSSGSSTDFELDFSGANSDFSDLGSLFGNNESFSNMRGTELYAAAKKKCAAVLTRCAPKKADQGIISGQYDIEIDKACVAYEAGLKKASAGVKTNIRSATQMLQKARLAVLDEHNTYDAKGCVSALDSCMRDGMVCGDNYYKCLDPTKTMIDENGTVIPGRDVNGIKSLVSTYGSNDNTIDKMLDPNYSGPSCSQTSTSGICVINYLKGKIGVSSGGRVQSGFCRPVLDRCRQYTYQDSTYVENNTIIKSYLERTMSQILAAQNSIIAEYASSCMQDVSACYNNQITQVNSYAGGMNLSPSVVKPVLMGACRNVALSCARAVFSGDAGNCPTTNTNPPSTATERDNTCIDNLSNIFYQAMLCPTNSTWSSATRDCNGDAKCPAPNNTFSTPGITQTQRPYVNAKCQCNEGYYVNNGSCVSSPICPANSTVDITATNPSNGSTTSQGIPIPYCKCIHKGTIASGGACPLVAPAGS